LQGLKYLHDSPIKKHGKLKSSNVVVDGRWTCKLTDYGLEILHDSLDGGNRGQDVTDGNEQASVDKRFARMYYTWCCTLGYVVRSPRSVQRIFKRLHLLSLE
jgi:serine/threonine protein kinase